jgi:ketosteroid isomerase-like protein
MIDEDTDDRAEIHDLFSRYADAVTGRQWELLDEVFTEDVTSTAQWSTEIAGRTALVRRIRDVIEPATKTHLLGNYTATIDGDVAEASVHIRVYRVCIEGPGRQHQKIFGSFRARLIRTAMGWRFRHFGMARSGIVPASPVSIT